MITGLQGGKQMLTGGQFGKTGGHKIGGNQGRGGQIGGQTTGGGQTMGGGQITGGGNWIGGGKMTPGGNAVGTRCKGQVGFFVAEHRKLVTLASKQKQ